MRVVLPGLLVLLLGCTGLFEPKTVVSDDGIAQLTVPFTFDPMELNDQAILEYGDEISDRYVVVLADAKADFEETADLAEFARSAYDRHLASLGNPADAAPVAGTIGGRPSVEYVVTGDVDGVRATFLLGLVDGEHHRYQVLAWTLASRFSRNEDDLREVVASFREGAERPLPPVPPRPTKVFRGSDEPVWVELPDDWQRAELSDAGTIEAKSPDNQAFVLVISEPVTEMPLSAFAVAARDLVTQSWTNPSTTDPTPVQIDGRDGWTCELRGGHDGVRVVGMFTAIRGAERFYQVLAWTVPSEWERRRPALAHVAQSLHEGR